MLRFFFSLREVDIGSAQSGYWKETINDNTNGTQGYTVSIEFDPEINMFFGKVNNIVDVVTFYGNSVEELKKELRNSVETYLLACKEKNISPEKPFSGRFNLRLSPQLHRCAVLASQKDGLSLNSWISKRIQEGLSGK